VAVIELGRRDADLERDLEAQLQGTFALDWRYEIGHDSNGYPAVWVWIVVPDEVAANARPELVGLSQRLETLVRGGGRYWPYVFFQSASEQEAARA